MLRKYICKETVLIRGASTIPRPIDMYPRRNDQRCLDAALKCERCLGKLRYILGENLGPINGGE